MYGMHVWHACMVGMVGMVRMNGTYGMCGTYACGFFPRLLDSDARVHYANVVVIREVDSEIRVSPEQQYTT